MINRITMGKNKLSGLKKEKMFLLNVHVPLGLQLDEGKGWMPFMTPSI